VSETSRQRWNHDQISEMVLSIGRHWVSNQVGAGIAIVVRQAKIIAFGPDRSRALTMLGELAETR
jgi:hypothetical protein